MDEQMKLFGADILPMTVTESSKTERLPYDVASDLVADYAQKAALRSFGDVSLRAQLHGYVSGVCEVLQLAEHQRAYLRAEAWHRAEEALMLRQAADN